MTSEYTQPMRNWNHSLCVSPSVFSRLLETEDSLGRKLGLTKAWQYTLSLTSGQNNIVSAYRKELTQSPHNCERTLNDDRI